jgi:hypothetical protein
VESIRGHTTLGHLILSSALGVGFILTYVASYSLGTIWMMGAQRVLVVVFIWCIILTSWMSATSELSSAVNMF